MLGSLLFPLVVRMRLKPLVVFTAVNYVIMLLGSIMLGLDENGHTTVRLFINAGWRTERFWVGVPRVLYCMACGIVIYKCRDRLRATKLAAAFLKIRHQQIVLGIALIVVFSFPYELGGLHYFAVVGCFVPLAVSLGVMMTPANERFKGMSHFLGWLSYPMYCIHQPLVNGMRAINGMYEFNDSSWWLPTLEGFAISLLLAFLLAKYFDDPLRKYLSGMLRSHFQARKAVMCEVR